MRTVILENGDMVITIPKKEKERQLQHLQSLEPVDRAQFDEITVLLNLVENKPTLKLIQGGKKWIAPS